MLVNLLGNALHHAPDAPIEITAQADEATETVELVVTDHGAGVPVSQHDHLFTPFRRLSDTPSGDGLGLGLAVSRGLSEAMAGSLTAGETPGGGLSMHVRLPAASRTP